MNVRCNGDHQGVFGCGTETVGRGNQERKYNEYENHHSFHCHSSFREKWENQWEKHFTEKLKKPQKVLSSLSQITTFCQAKGKRSPFQNRVFMI
jgi:hypothetical protein